MVAVVDMEFAAGYGFQADWRRLQEQGVSSSHGLREHDAWRYVMISAPDGLLLELFEFDDPAARCNISGRVMTLWA